jgi:hypothetical protein
MQQEDQVAQAASEAVPPSHHDAICEDAADGIVPALSLDSPRAAPSGSGARASSLPCRLLAFNRLHQRARILQEATRSLQYGRRSNPSVAPREAAAQASLHPCG